MQGENTLTKQTRRFIGENSVVVAFSREVRTPDGAGGYTTGPAPVPAQVVRIVERESVAQVERRNVAGEVVRPAFNIIAMPDTDILRGDKFTWQGHRAEVVWITVLPYELICEVALR